MVRSNPFSRVHASSTASQLLLKWVFCCHEERRQTRFIASETACAVFGPGFRQSLFQSSNFSTEGIGANRQKAAFGQKVQTPQEPLLRCLFKRANGRGLGFSLSTIRWHRAQVLRLHAWRPFPQTHSKAKRFWESAVLWKAFVCGYGRLRKAIQLCAWQNSYKRIVHFAGKALPERRPGNDSESRADRKRSQTVGIKINPFLWYQGSASGKAVTRRGIKW